MILVYVSYYAPYILSRTTVYGKMFQFAKMYSDPNFKGKSANGLKTILYSNTFF